MNFKYKVRDVILKIIISFPMILSLNFLHKTIGLRTTVSHNQFQEVSLKTCSKCWILCTSNGAYRSTMCNVRKDLETMIYAYRRVHPLPNQSAASVAEIGQGRRAVSQFCRAYHTSFRIFMKLYWKSIDFFKKNSLKSDIFKYYTYMYISEWILIVNLIKILFH